MLKAILDVLDLLLNQPLLLLLYIELEFSVVIEDKIVHVLHELFPDVFQSFESTCQKEESLDVLLSSGCNGTLQGGDLLIDAAHLVSHWEED